MNWERASPDAGKPSPDPMTSEKLPTGARPCRWFWPKRKFPRRLSYLNQPGVAAEKERRKPLAPLPTTTCPFQRLFLAFSIPVTLPGERGKVAAPS